MNREEIDEFLGESRNVILASVNAQGDPVQVPLWFAWHDGKVYISVTTERGFYPNLQRRPRVSLCVDVHRQPVRTVLIRGDVRVIEGDGQWPHVERIVARYVPEDGHAARMEMLRSQPRVILEVTPTMITSWSPTPADRDIWKAG